MIKDLVLQWEENKDRLEHFFKITSQEKYESYMDIVKKLIECCFKDYDADRIHVVDDGEYHGTEIFIIPERSCDPGIYDYVYTHNEYGSCSGCDTLEYIRDEGMPSEDGLPDERQIRMYMDLALHLVQKMRYFETDIKG